MKLFNSKAQKARDTDNQLFNDWKSFKLTKRNILPLLTLDIILIAALSVIWILSDRLEGFGLPEGRSRRIGKIDWQLSLTWTFLPSFILQIFALWVATTIDAAGFRQPFIELARGAPAAKSIHLDYASFWPLQREYKALRLRHWHLFCLLSLSLLLKPTLGPLGAHMLAEGPYTRNVFLEQDVALLTDVPPSGEMGWNLASVISLTASDSSYGRWSNGNQTFLNFSFPSIQAIDADRASLTVSTAAYFGTLNCSVLPDLETHLRFSDSANSNSQGRVILTSAEPTCNWTFNTAFDSTTPTHLETFITTRCPDSSSRLIVMSGTIKSATTYNVSIISCQPSYWKSVADLSFTLSASANQMIGNWVEHSGSVKSERPDWWSLYENGMQQEVGSTSSSSAEALSQITNPIGKIILDRIRASSSDPMDYDSLTLTTTEVWANLYSLLLGTYMIKPIEKPNLIQGYLTTDNDRLYAVKPIIAIVLVLLGLIAVSVIFVFWYTARHVSVLREEPVGILGYADLLADSCLTDDVREIRQRPGYDGRASKIFLTEYAKSAKSTKFTMQDIENLNRRHIIAASVVSGSHNAPLLDRTSEQQATTVCVQSRVK